ncbi:DUF6328 family protein [Mycolicibacterium novocastrense]|uniref:DUF6328 family protein n=1 Tax=Mycolicibacterium novocastrense TaxID=59813 RepID=UPI001F2C10B8
MQFLFGFLLAVVFLPGFEHAPTCERVIHLATISTAVTALITRSAGSLAPVATSPSAPYQSSTQGDSALDRWDGTMIRVV